jgi:hypothetical protein
MMRNVNVVMAVLLSIAAMASGVEVISIDINGYGSTAAYSGEAAVAGATEWVAYDSGWGIPAGSPRSADLAKDGTVQPSTYAEQVWIGDSGIDHNYVYGEGTGLLDDGFVATGEPNLVLYGGGAYGGTFDVYIYGNSAGVFKLTDANDVNPAVIAEGSVTGTVTPGVFAEGINYVRFENITISNRVLLWYSNELNGIQLVSTKHTPKIINPDSTDPNDYSILATAWDVAYDTNARGGESTLYGPDQGGAIYFIDNGEYMEYDIWIDEAYEGQYALSADVGTQWGPAEMTVYLKDKTGSLGTLTAPQQASGVHETTAVTVNLLAGLHTIKWAAESNNIFFDLVRLKLNYLGPVVLTDCAEVKAYGLQPAGDINGDCRVDMMDLEALAAEWTESNDPQ